MLWIALHLPDLSLQATTRGLLPHIPVAITETHVNRTLICAANAVARDMGAVVGNTAAAARAVAGDIVLLPRDVGRERDTLSTIALSALQFTPGVSIVRDALMLDVESSLTLFGGLGKLCNALRQMLRQLGFQASLGVAPTPLAAEIFARAKASGCEARACMDPAGLEERLRVLPSRLLPWDEATLQTLAVLGLASVGQLLDLPRDGVLRRFGFECARDLERMTGRVPDPREPVSAPERFRTTFDLAAEIDNVELCLNAIDRLLAEAQGFLSARGAATSTLALTLHHGRQLTTRQEIGSSIPQRDRQQWLMLVREQLQRSPLPAAVTSIDLAIDTVCEYLPPPSALPGCAADPRAQIEDRLRLLDRLAARLGKEKVCTIALRDEHRPEEASSIRGQKTEDIGQKVEGIGLMTGDGRQRTEGRRRAMPALWRGASSDARPRPTWLLDRPRALVTRDEMPMHHGPLMLLAGPERIQTGWWDNHPVARDYFVARNPLGETCWVYREIQRTEDRGQKSEDRNRKTEDRRQRPETTRQWFLHGVFG